MGNIFSGGMQVKKLLVLAIAAALILALSASASATDVIFGISYRAFKPQGEAFDISSDFKANLGLKLDVSKIFETHLSLKLGAVREDLLDPESAMKFGIAGELDAVFSLLNWQIGEDYLIKLGPIAGVSFANGGAYQPDGSIDLFLGAFLRFDFMESFRVDGKISYGFMSKGVLAGLGMEYAFTPNWFIRADFEYMRKNGFFSISGGYRF